MADRTYSTFIPGEEPGDFALGTPQHPDDLGRMAAYKLKMSKIPTGAAVAERFPWWRKVRENMQANEKLILLRPGWQATFENTSDHDVSVDEIRFRTDFRNPILTYQTRLWCKIGIPPRREIISDWTPVQVLHTEKDRMYAANLDAYTYELPKPYVLQRGNQFVMDWRYNVAFVIAQQPAVPNPTDEWGIMCGLHGYGLQDNEPISLMKAVKGWPFVTGLANQWQTIAFDEEQNRPMRDAVITHISFGSTLITDIANVLEALEFRPHAPEGPEWHQNEFFALRDLSEQIGTFASVDYYCIHRPIIPYTLLKGEGILIELWNRHNDLATVNITLRGSQASRR